MDLKIKETWIDITEEFKESVQHLELGELMKCEQFSLLEAMGAAEMMDPKMDRGMILKNANRKIYNLDKAIELNLVKAENLELNELIGIIDHTYCCYVTWLDGHPLAQTVMTNLYLQNPELILDKPLKAFSQAILKLLHFTDRLIAMVCCIEEEDFCLNMEKFSFDVPINDQKLITLLDEVCQYYEGIFANLSVNQKQQNQVNSKNQLQNNIKISGQTKADENNKKPTNCNVNANGESGNGVAGEKNSARVSMSDLDKELVRGLLDRFRFTHNFLSAFNIINRNIVTNEYELRIQDCQQFNKVIKTIQTSISTSTDHFNKCLESLDRWKSSINSGIKPDVTDANVDNTCEDYPTIMGFEPLINQRLLPPAYPRCPKIAQRSEMLDQLRILIQKLKHCLSISNSFVLKSCLLKSITTMEQFSKYHTPRSCVLTRSLLQLLYLPNRSKYLIKEELNQSMIEFCEPMIELMKIDDVRTNALDDFLSECSRSFSQLICIYGHNSSRQHERLPDIIFSMKNLQYSALLLNNAFNNTFLYCWTSYHLARVTIRYILSAMELELYSSYEYPYVFWYLGENLMRTEHEQLEQTKKYVLENQKFLDEQQKRTKMKGKQRRKRYSTIFHDLELHKNEAISTLARGLFFITLGLRKQGKIRTPKMDYTSEQIFFERRFGIFNNLNHYHRYKQIVDELDDLPTIYKLALDWFSEAKVLLEGLEDGENLLKVCKTNLIVSKILSTNHEDAFKSRVVEFTFELHPSYPTIKINYN